MAAPSFDPRFVEVGIASGVLDAELDNIESALQRRRAFLASEKIASLTVGDVFAISDSVRPKLLAGSYLRVVEFVGIDKVKGEILHYTGSQKWRQGMRITVPKSLIGRKIEGE